MSRNRINRRQSHGTALDVPVRASGFEFGHEPDDLDAHEPDVSTATSSPGDSGAGDGPPGQRDPQLSFEDLAGSVGFPTRARRQPAVLLQRLAARRAVLAVPIVGIGLVLLLPRLFDDRAGAPEKRTTRRSPEPLAPPTRPQVPARPFERPRPRRTRPPRRPRPRPPAVTPQPAAVRLSVPAPPATSPTPPAPAGQEFGFER